MLERFHRSVSRGATVGVLDAGWSPDRSTEALMAQLRFEANVCSVGTVSYEESPKYIEAASICVLVETKVDEGIYLPSKLVDYLSAGKPVLALVDDAASVQEALTRFYSDWTKGQLQRCAPPDAQVNRFRPDVVAGNFLRAAQELADAKHHGKAF